MMKQPTTGELLRVLSYEEILDYVHRHIQPKDLYFRVSQLHHKSPDQRRCHRYLRALHLGIDLKRLTRSKKAWELTSVVLLEQQVTCWKCTHQYRTVCDFMLKSTHPFYGVHISAFDKDCGYSDYDDLPIEIYTRSIQVLQCSNCQ